MPGGRFIPGVSKALAGVYTNIRRRAQSGLSSKLLGVVLVPIVGAKYGPLKTWISVTLDNVDTLWPQLGYHLDETDMLLINEALKEVREVLTYIPATGGAKAHATVGVLTATMKQVGTRGNDSDLVIAANPSSGFNVLITLNGEYIYGAEGIDTVAHLPASDWVDFSGTGDLTASAGTPFTGGTDASTTNSDVTGMLDASETQDWNALAFPYTDSSLLAALKSKIEYFRDELGLFVTASAPNYAGDTEGIFSLLNGVILEDGTNLTAAQACAWHAAACASAKKNQSLTYKAYPGAASANPRKTHEEQEAGTEAGHCVFGTVPDAEGNNVVGILYDQNTLVTYADDQPVSMHKGRVLRALDQFQRDVALAIPPNKFDNNPDGWDGMEAVGKALLLNYQKENAFKNVDTSTDFKVDRVKSVDPDHPDATFIDAAAQPVDSAEKIYISVVV